MQTVIPQLRMLNAERSLDFYLRQLGFGIDWEHRFAPHMPLFCSITRQGQTVYLSEHAGDCQPGGAVFFKLPDAQAAYDAFVRQGVQPTKPIADTPWGTREFLLTDPAGNKLRFATYLNTDEATPP